jgi:hypothetical protein
MANPTSITNAFISLNDIINNFIISYTGPGKLIPDSKRTEVVFHARRSLQEFSYETLKGQFLIEELTTPLTYPLPKDYVAMVTVQANNVEFAESAVNTPALNQYFIDYVNKEIKLNAGNQGNANFKVKYLSNALTTDESAAIPKLAEEALYSCIVYAILANREKTNPGLLQRLLIEKTDKLEKAKSRLVFTNFSS